MSCASAGNCTAVGEYNDSSGNGQALFLSETGGTWAAGTQAALPANAGSNPWVDLRSVSCASVGECSAVGYYIDSSGDQQGLLVNETGGVWARGIEAILPANAQPGDVFLDSVSCASPGNCSAVGQYDDTSGSRQVLLLSEVGRVWGAGTEAALPAGANDNTAFGSSVSCASAGNCAAVGEFIDSSGNGHGLLMTEVAGTWSAGTAAALPANAAANGGAVLDSVSCASAGDCSAVGTYADSSGKAQGLLLNEVAGTWSAGMEATLPAGGDVFAEGFDLGSVSCGSAGNCSAIGSYEIIGVSPPPPPQVFLTEVAGTWQPGIELPTPDGAVATGRSGLAQVSCASSGDCVATGGYTDSSQAEQGMLLSETGNEWLPGVEAVPPPNAAPDPSVDLRWVSCPAVDACSVVGTYDDDSGNTQGLLLNNQTAGQSGGHPGHVENAVVSGLRVTPRMFALRGRRVHGRCAKQTPRDRGRRRCARLIKLTVSYRLNTSARVTITITHLLPGRLLKRRCVTPTRKTRKRQRCIRLVLVRGALTKTGVQGANTFTLTGRFAGHNLAAGSYRLTATPHANGAAGTSRTIAFKIAP